MDLGGFTTVADRKSAKSAAATVAALLFAAGSGAAFGLKRYLLFVASAAIAIVVYLVYQRIAMSRAPKGVVDVIDDPRLGPMLTLVRKGHTLHRVPLKKATILGRTQTMKTVGPVRLQIEVKWSEGSFVAALAVPFRGADGDVEGVLPTVFDLDRTASRALDALSYEVKELKR